MTSGTHNRIIRIFISSTFSDFNSERNTLSSEVFEELRRMCESRGFSFHPIDLRWGVSHADSEKNIALRICLNEIDRCKELSPKINFFIMVSDYYGWQPLPETIESKAWNILTQKYDDNSAELILLKRFYQQDTNDVRRPYCLRSRPEIESGGSRSVEEDDVRQIFNSMLYTPDISLENIYETFKWQCNASATEQEIARGYFSGHDESRFNTFILLKNGTQGDAPEDPAKTLSAKRLKGRLRKAANGNIQLYEMKTASDNEWVERARDFLADAIQRQMDEYAGTSRFSQMQDALYSAYHHVDKYYIPASFESCVTQFLEINRGHCVLITGESGSGKSWLLRHLASNLDKQQIVAAVFNDVEADGRSFVSALELIARTLREKGMMGGNSAFANTDDPVGWFERELRRLNHDKSVLIILDSIHGQNMPDYVHAKGGSLFRMQLPEFVTMIVTAVTRNDLRECDKSTEIPHLELSQLTSRDAIRRLHLSLSRHGRKLCNGSSNNQRLAAETFLYDSTSLHSALAVEILVQICAKLRSWDPFPSLGVPNFENVVQYALFGQNSDEYMVLRRHTLGFIALSAMGLTELEIIDLLSSDADVVHEIRQQTYKAQAKWNFSDSIPTVLWAMQYAELRPYLMEINDEGAVLFQLRHTRLREAILSKLEPKEYRKLCTLMRDYYRKQMWLLFGGGNVLPNFRKVSELLPVYEKLQDEASLADCLSQPICIDAFVRLGKRTAICSYLERYGRSAISASMLRTLQKKELLFRLWPNSFIPAAMQELRFSDDAAKDATKKLELLRLTGNRSYTVGNTDTGNELFFPELYGKCEVAIDSCGHIATLMNGVIRIIDSRKYEMLPTHCLSTKEECFLYWNGETLIVRCKRRRLRYSFMNDQLTFMEEDHGVEDWDHLQRDTYDDIRRAGGWMEAERFGFCSINPTLPNLVRYHLNDEIRKCEIFEPYDYDLNVKAHGALAAIVFDHYDLVIAELTTGIKVFEEAIRGITDVEWSDSGETLLVVIRGNTFKIINVDRKRNIGSLAGPQSSPIYHKVVNCSRFVADMGRAPHELFVLNPRAYRANEGPSPSIPLFGALSIKHEWAACYFYDKTGAFIRVLNTKNHKGFRINDVSEITYTDCKSDPFYAATNYNGIVLTSHGKSILYDLQARAAKTVAKDSLDKATLDENAQSVRTAYVSRLVEALHLNKEEIPYLRLGYSDVFASDSLYWLVDKDNGLVHAFNHAGICMCRDMTSSKILSADIDARNGRLHLLLSTGQILQIGLTVL